LLSALVTSLVISPLATAANKATSEKQLKSVLSKIEKLKQTIDVKEDSRSQYIRQLKLIEHNIGKLSQKIRAVGKKIETKKSRLASLRATRLKHQRQLSKENDYLAEQVYAAFTLGRQEKVKLLFSQQDPQTLQRNLVYYQYFSNARVNLINNVKANIDKIIETEQLIEQAQLELKKNQQTLAQQKKQFDKDRKSVV
jgi:septal ring factor EnvC (AmiA/AmiB activator)